MTDPKYRWITMCVNKVDGSDFTDLDVDDLVDAVFGSIDQTRFFAAGGCSTASDLLAELTKKDRPK